MTANRVKVRLVPGCSDGDPLHVPPPGAHTQLDPPTLYLEKIGQQWMESRGEAKPGVQYILEDLPFGYTLWHRPRPSKPSHFDKYLYGHPGKKAFDSPNRFFPHFLHLMNNNGNSIGCPCTLCSGSAGVLPKTSANSSQVRSSSAASSRKSSNSSIPMQSRPSSAHSAKQLPVALPPSLAPQHKGRPKKITPGLDTTNVDSEGTPDVYRNLIDKLRRHRDVDEPILEPLSPDWRAEQDHLRKFLNDIKTQDQWVPRTGDIVLYIRNMPDTVELVRDNSTGELQLYDERRKQHLGAPQWAAGLVTEPATGTTVAELVASTQERNVSSIGVRVEPIPNPNESDKSLSKRHKYVLLRQTSPFMMWRDLLRRIPQEEWHDTVKNALALMSTLSLMGKYRFRGSWPNASIYCHGIYVGAEMLAVGDTVRLLPNKQSGQSGCTDVMSIKSIRLKWTNLDKASDNDYDEGRPYNSEIWIYGSAYTSDSSRSNKLWVTEHNVEAPRVANDYADWFPLHPADKELAIPYSRVLGRLHERDAMAYFLKSDHEDLPGLDVGRHAVTEARAFARKHDNRIAAESDATWYWGDDRADALNLHTINGLDVSRYDLDRDVKDLRRKYRQLDGIAKGDAKPTGQDILDGRGLRTFMAPALPLRTSGAKAPSESGSSMASESHASRKRTHIVDLDDEDDTEEDDIDEEIREHTKVVAEDGERPKKKPKVMVVID
ncbi:uncharacterized protein J4E84_010831 [Alternaria hordeiaustralica]|uniref:uncharacterized protein n=1 Tax=Alternaria hordeiaustralica TaxID=1187925 RepID=UPI0020C229D0|nr:uncharacterized protein J4E84_010831 [Alternaria hordeiaustralica]KAI4674131.1 hypothetical protein J4E84_010831 [Alternaria hordeiaustralica]